MPVAAVVPHCPCHGPVPGVTSASQRPGPGGSTRIPVPAFVIFRDRAQYAQRCVIALLAAGLEPVIVDQGSTWEPALDWLDDMAQDGMRVLRHDGGHRGCWQWEPFRQACGTGRYVVTDPDVVPAQDCPADWLAHLGRVLDVYPGWQKAGLGLRTDNLPAHYRYRDQVVAWESQFARSQVEPGIFGAPVDTTLALYHPLSDWDRFTLAALRTGAPYTADHLAWHEDLDDLDPELTLVPRARGTGHPVLGAGRAGGRSAADIGGCAAVSCSATEARFGWNIYAGQVKIVAARPDGA